jgi:hypothetical protein
MGGGQRQIAQLIGHLVGQAIVQPRDPFTVALSGRPSWSVRPGELAKHLLLGTILLSIAAIATGRVPDQLLDDLIAADFHLRDG